jgi:signal peptidase II
VQVQVLIVAIVLLWLGADQALKFWTVANMPPPPYYAAYEPFPAFMSLAHAINTGAAWSLFSGATPILIAFRLVAGAGILMWLWRKPRPPLQAVALSFIAAGALGNAIDGLLYGHVVDMLQSHWLTAVYRIVFPNQIFPIFNLADCGVVGGVLLYLVLSFVAPQKSAPFKHTPQL